MKKALFITLILLLSFFSGCQSGGKPEDAGKIKIIATIFPPYDFAREIASDKAEISMLIPPGGESHSFEPTPKDIIEIQNCDLFIYVGGESESFIDDILKSVGNKTKTLTLMECVNVVEEELKDGMEAGEIGEKNKKEYDEHVWTSPKNAIKIVSRLTEVLSEIDGKNSKIYENNCKSYTEKLTSLDNEFTELFKTSKNKTLIFGDRFPFRYFTDCYNLPYFAAFPGCSHQSEPSFGSTVFLINKVKSEKISTVFYIEFSNHKVADSIAKETGAKTALLHSCHNVSPEEINKVSYLSLMRQNLETLKKALQ